MSCSSARGEMGAIMVLLAAMLPLAAVASPLRFNPLFR